jgi:hypothetical protein
MAITDLGRRRQLPISAAEESGSDISPVYCYDVSTGGNGSPCEIALLRLLLTGFEGSSSLDPATQE